MQLFFLPNYVQISATNTLRQCVCVCGGGRGGYFGSIFGL